MKSAPSIRDAGVGDVSALGRVHTLHLSYCPGVGDVSALGHVRSLHLSYCPGVGDVSALGNKVKQQATELV